MTVLNINVDENTNFRAVINDVYNIVDVQIAINQPSLQQCVSVNILLTLPVNTSLSQIDFVWPSNIAWAWLLSDILGIPSGSPPTPLELQNDGTAVIHALITLTTMDGGDTWVGDGALCDGYMVGPIDYWSIIHTDPNKSISTAPQNSLPWYSLDASWITPPVLDTGSGSYLGQVVVTGVLGADQAPWNIDSVAVVDVNVFPNGSTYIATNPITYRSVDGWYAQHGSVVKGMGSDRILTMQGNTAGHSTLTLYSVNNIGIPSTIPTAATPANLYESTYTNYRAQFLDMAIISSTKALIVYQDRGANGSTDLTFVNIVTLAGDRNSFTYGTPVPLAISVNDMSGPCAISYVPGSTIAHVITHQFDNGGPVTHRIDVVPVDVSGASPVLVGTRTSSVIPFVSQSSESYPASITATTSADNVYTIVALNLDNRTNDTVQSKVFNTGTDAFSPSLVHDAPITFAGTNVVMGAALPAAADYILVQSLTTDSYHVSLTAMSFDPATGALINFPGGPSKIEFHYNYPSNATYDKRCPVLRVSDSAVLVLYSSDTSLVATVISTGENHLP